MRRFWKYFWSVSKDNSKGDINSLGLQKPCYVDEQTHYRYYDIK